VCKILRWNSKRLLRKPQKMLGGYFILPHPVYIHPHSTTHNNQILHGDQIRLEENFSKSTTPPPILGQKNLLIRMLTRDLFAVANLLCICIISEYVNVNTAWNIVQSYVLTSQQSLIRASVLGRFLSCTP